MQVLSRQINRSGAESLVIRLAGQLQRHAWMDAFLVCAPPALAAGVFLVLLFKNGWLDLLPAVLAASGIFVSAMAVVFLRSRRRAASLGGAARLVDEKSGARDHFLTLATIDTRRQPPAFVAQLRRQTEGFVQRVELRRDFPYRFKRSAFWSFGASLAAAALAYLVLVFAPTAPLRSSAQERLSEIVQQMTAQPSLRALGRELQNLAIHLDQPKIPPGEKQEAIDKMEQRIEEQRAKESESENRDLLGKAADALHGLEKEQQAAAGEGQKQQDKGAGGVQINTPQQGKGENTQTQSGSGEGKGDSNAQLSQQKMDQGNPAKANSKEQGREKNQSGDVKNNQKQPDPNQPSTDPTKEKAGKNQGDSKEGAGKQKASEEPPPQGGPQADRFYKPGEGKEALAGKKGYVTVQLPEEIVADDQGESMASKEAKSGRGRTRVPLSNVPLPAHVPNAPTEKQQVPIEYRGILR